MPISFKAIRNTGVVVDARATTASLQKNMRKYGETLVKSLQGDYSRVLPSKSYKRKFKPPTGKQGLGGHWHISVSGDGQAVDVYNDVPYAGYVQGHPDQQAEQHVDRGWGSIDDHAAATSVVFRKLIGDSIVEGIQKARQNRNRKGQFSSSEID